MKIAISGLNATDNPAPGLPVAKSLQNHKLIGFSYDPNEPANYLDNFKTKYLMPYPALGFEELKSRLEYITQKEEQIDLIIPCLDAELPLYIKYQNELEKIGIKTFLPNLESFELRNKNKLAKLAKELNLKYPATFELASIKEIVDLIREEKIKFPFMVKGNYYKAYKAHTIEEAIEHFYTISNSLATSSSFGLFIVIPLQIFPSDVVVSFFIETAPFKLPFPSATPTRFISSPVTVS